MAPRKVGRVKKSLFDGSPRIRPNDVLNHRDKKAPVKRKSTTQPIKSVSSPTKRSGRRSDELNKQPTNELENIDQDADLYAEEVNGNPNSVESGNVATTATGAVTRGNKGSNMSHKYEPKANGLQNGKDGETQGQMPENQNEAIPGTGDKTELELTEQEKKDLAESVKSSIAQLKIEKAAAKKKRKTQGSDDDGDDDYDIESEMAANFKDQNEAIPGTGDKTELELTEQEKKDLAESVKSSIAQLKIEKAAAKKKRKTQGSDDDGDDDYDIESEMAANFKDGNDSSSSEELTVDEVSLSVEKTKPSSSAGLIAHNKIVQQQKKKAMGSRKGNKPLSRPANVAKMIHREKQTSLIAKEELEQDMDISYSKFNADLRQEDQPRKKKSAKKPVTKPTSSNDVVVNPEIANALAGSSQPPGSNELTPSGAQKARVSSATPKTLSRETSASSMSTTCPTPRRVNPVQDHIFDANGLIDKDKIKDMRRYIISDLAKNDRKGVIFQLVDHVFLKAVSSSNESNIWPQFWDVNWRGGQGLYADHVACKTCLAVYKRTTSTGNSNLVKHLKLTNWKCPFGNNGNRHSQPQLPYTSIENYTTTSAFVGSPVEKKYHELAADYAASEPEFADQFQKASFHRFLYNTAQLATRFVIAQPHHFGVDYKKLAVVIRSNAKIEREKIKELIETNLVLGNPMVWSADIALVGEDNLLFYLGVHYAESNGTLHLRTVHMCRLTKTNNASEDLDGILIDVIRDVMRSNGYDINDTDYDHVLVTSNSSKEDLSMKGLFNAICVAGYDSEPSRFICPQTNLGDLLAYALHSAEKHQKNEGTRNSSTKTFVDTLKFMSGMSLLLQAEPDQGRHMLLKQQIPKLPDAPMQYPLLYEVARAYYDNYDDIVQYSQTSSVINSWQKENDDDLPSDSLPTRAELLVVANLFYSINQAYKIMGERGNVGSVIPLLVDIQQFKGVDSDGNCVKNWDGKANTEIKLFMATIRRVLGEEINRSIGGCLQFATKSGQMPKMVGVPHKIGAFLSPHFKSYKFAKGGEVEKKQIRDYIIEKIQSMEVPEEFVGSDPFRLSDSEENLDKDGQSESGDNEPAAAQSKKRPPGHSIQTHTNSWLAAQSLNPETRDSAEVTTWESHTFKPDEAKDMLCPIKFWCRQGIKKSYPKLQKVAISTFIIPTKSAQVGDCINEGESLDMLKEKYGVFGPETLDDALFMRAIRKMDY